MTLPFADPDPFARTDRLWSEAARASILDILISQLTRELEESNARNRELVDEIERLHSEIVVLEDRLNS